MNDHDLIKCTQYIKMMIVILNVMPFKIQVCMAAERIGNGVFNAVHSFPCLYPSQFWLTDEAKDIQLHSIGTNSKSMRWRYDLKVTK